MNEGQPTPLAEQLKAALKKRGGININERTNLEKDFIENILGTNLSDLSLTKNGKPKIRPPKSQDSGIQGATSRGRKIKPKPSSQ